ncbi:MAG: hypothetical protein MZU95_13105 [Desulfomicrobium escambiense]|nr:hypothetical protein [Desulfomicrobium escambiense]
MEHDGDPDHLRGLHRSAHPQSQHVLLRPPRQVAVLSPAAEEAAEEPGRRAEKAAEDRRLWVQIDRPPTAGSPLVASLLIVLSARGLRRPRSPSLVPPSGGIEAVEGFASATISGTDAAVKGRFAFVFRRPGFGRIEAVDPIGRTAFLVLFRGDRAWFVLPGQKAYAEDGARVTMERFLADLAPCPTRRSALLSGLWAGFGPAESGWALERDERGRVARGGRDGFLFTVRELLPRRRRAAPDRPAGRGDVGSPEESSSSPSTRPRADGRLRYGLPPRLRPEDMGRDPGAHRTMTVRSFAKINLGLEIVGKRSGRLSRHPDALPDGLAPRRARPRARAAGHGRAGRATIPPIAWDRTNLVDRAARRLLEKAEADGRGPDLGPEVHPGRPGPRRGQLQCRGDPPGPREDVGSRPGGGRAGRPGQGPRSRCPLFLKGGLCLGEGIGDILTPLADLEPLPCLLDLPAILHPHAPRSTRASTPP